MDYQIILAGPARRDLRDIVRYISADAPDRASAFGEFLIEKTRNLAHFPELGRKVPEIKDGSAREIIVRSYRIIYRVSHAERVVEVMRFWHAARGTPRLGK